MFPRPTVELGDDAVPDKTTILRFRHLLEQHKLTGAMFEAVSAIPLKILIVLSRRSFNSLEPFARGVASHFNLERNPAKRPHYNSTVSSLEPFG